MSSFRTTTPFQLLHIDHFRPTNQLDNNQCLPHATRQSVIIQYYHTPFFASKQTFPNSRVSWGLMKPLKSEGSFQLLIWNGTRTQYSAIAAWLWVVFSKMTQKINQQHCLHLLSKFHLQSLAVINTGKYFLASSTLCLPYEVTSRLATIT